MLWVPAARRQEAPSSRVVINLKCRVPADTLRLYKDTGYCVSRKMNGKGHQLVICIGWAPGSEVPKLARNCAGSQVGLWLKCSSPAAEIKSQLKQRVIMDLTGFRSLAAD